MELTQAQIETDLGLLPKGWSAARLDMLGTGARPSIKAGPFGSALKKDVYVRDGYKVYGQEQVIRGDYEYGDYFITREKYRALYGCSVFPGDILLSLVGTTGKVLVLPDGAPEGVINPRLIRFSFDRNRVDSTFFKGLIESSRMQGLLASKAQGGTMSVLSAGLLSSIVIPLPPLAEQRAIAEALSDVGALIAALDALIAKKRAVKTAAMQQLLTGRQRLPGFSGEWKAVSLSEVGSFSKGKGIRKDEVMVDGLPCVRYGELYTKHVDVIRTFASHIPRSVAVGAQPIKRGDILFAGSGETKEEIGMAAAYLDDHEAYAGGDIIILSPRAANSAFLGYVLNTPQIAGQKASSAQGDAVVHISAASLGRITLDLPPVDEQEAIASVLSDMDAEIAALEARRDKTRHVKTGMMQELLTGRTRLVQPSVSVQPVRERPVRPAKRQGHNWPIDEAVVLGCLAERFGSPSWPLARVRRTKLTYLHRRHAGQAPKGFLKQAAGPYNPKARYSGPEQIAKKNGYVREAHNGTYEGFVASERVDKALGYFETWYGAEALDWLEQFRRLSTDDLGALTTVDYAALELRRAGKDVTVEAVKGVLAADAAWAPKLAQAAFTDEKIEASLQMSAELFGTAVPDDQ